MEKGGNVQDKPAGLDGGGNIWQTRFGLYASFDAARRTYRLGPVQLCCTAGSKTFKTVMAPVRTLADSM